MRAVSRTTLSLGDLLEVPIGIAAATGSREVKLDTACPDGVGRVQQYVHPTDRRTLYERDGDTGELTEVEVPVVVTDSIKGVRVGGELMEIPPSELDYAQASTKLESVELLEFIDYRRVPTDRLAGSFWLQPDPGFAKPLGTIMAAMRRTQRAMLVKFNVRSRQRLGVVRVRKTDEGPDALLLNAVVYAADWRKPDADVLAPAVAEPDERAVAAAVRIIEDLSGDGDHLDKAKDDYLDEMDRIIEHVHDRDYADPGRVLALASSYREEGLDVRADELVAWAEQRWPQLVEQREEVQRVIAEGGDDVGEKLAAIVA